MDTLDLVDRVVQQLHRWDIHQWVKEELQQVDTLCHRLLLRLHKVVTLVSVDKALVDIQALARVPIRTQVVIQALVKVVIQERTVHTVVVKHNRYQLQQMRR